MTRMKRLPPFSLVGCFLVGLMVGQVRAERPMPASFDAERYMRVSEVKPGMKGYGLSVFRGTKIDRFDVEVLSILKNFNPQHDVILISCKGANLEHTGSIAGMSGSPIFLTDGQGKERMIGAFAYGWPMMKDPIGGVQPIEYMLDLPVSIKDGDEKTGLPTAAGPGPDKARNPRPEGRNPNLTWHLSDAVMLPGMTRPPAEWPFAGINNSAVNPRLGVDDSDVTKLRPLATPLMAAGLPTKLMEEYSPIFRAYGMVPLQAGAIAGGSTTRDTRAATRPAAGDLKLEPGSAIVVPLLIGDGELSAVGTCTEVIGDQVYGFGHPFNNEGPVTLPMGTGQINGVIANLMTSFKLGALDKITGTLCTDEAVGVAGKLGDAPKLVPIDLQVTYADGSDDRHYHFLSAMHPRFTPLLSAAALGAAVTGAKDLPQYHTLDFQVTLEFMNGQSIQIRNRLVNASPAELFYEIGTPMMAAANNPFQRVMVRQISGKVTVTSEAKEARILSVNVPRLKYRPGETVKAYVTYRPFRAEEAVLPVELGLPRDLPEGKYQLAIGDWETYLQNEQQARPFRFTAQSINEVFAVLKDVTSTRHDALYLRLLRQADGVAIGRTAMPNLPSSIRQVMLGAGRSNTTPFVSSTIKTIPTEYVMSGQAQFAITIDKDARVEVGGAKSGKAEKADEKPRSEETKPKPAIKGEPAPKGGSGVEGDEK